MLKRLMSLGAAALAALGSACEDGPATIAGTWRSPATWSSMVHATRSGPMLVEVHGRPFDDGAGDFPARVAEAMTDQVFGRRTAFTTRRDQAAEPGLRVVLAFNPPPGLHPDSLCEGNVPTAAAPRERVTVQATFCDHGRRLASAEGWVAKVTGPDDKRFRQLIGQLTRELFGTPS